MAFDLQCKTAGLARFEVRDARPVSPPLGLKQLQRNMTKAVRRSVWFYVPIHEMDNRSVLSNSQERKDIIQSFQTQ